MTLTIIDSIVHVIDRMRQDFGKNTSYIWKRATYRKLYCQLGLAKKNNKYKNIRSWEM